MPAKKTVVQFPIQIRHGSVTIKIYRTATKSGTVFTVAWYVARKRFRQAFADLDEARRFANLKAREIAHGDAAALRLTSDDRLTYLRAVEALEGLEAPLDEVARHYADAMAKLGNTPLAEAISFYVKRNPAKLPVRRVSEVVDEFKTAKLQQGLSRRYLEDIDYRCGRFAAAFDCPIGAITSTDLRDWLNGLDLSARSHNNFVSALITLFNFAKARGYLQRDHDELTGIEERKVPRGEIDVFTPGEMTRLLAAASDDFVPCIAIGGFAGLRSQEIERLEWDEVNLDERFIKISAVKAKTGSRRLAPVTDNLAAWLAPYSERTGPVWPHGHDFFYESQRRTAKLAAVKWKANALRHSFISYRVAETKDTARVALEAGNSPKVIFANYLELVRPGDAVKWFHVFPE